MFISQGQKLVTASLILSLSGCGDGMGASIQALPSGNDSLSSNADKFLSGIEVIEAPQDVCPSGGNVILIYKDQNSDGARQNTESILSAKPICNGMAGQDGADGQNGIDGQNGSNGLSSSISVTSASLAQCPAGGHVYSVISEGESSINIVCNGQNGSNGADGAAGSDGANGQDAVFSMGKVGSEVAGKSYSACHHDYLYFPNASEPSRGWLTFRHQGNGSLDQGIGSTGFQVWNVDIANFALASEMGNTTYCTLQYDATAQTLTYTVVDNSDGLQGQSGTIQLGN